eukprot:36048-Eustigmatos_ZCMA.PRE.1
MHGVDCTPGCPPIAVGPVVEQHRMDLQARYMASSIMELYLPMAQRVLKIRAVGTGRLHFLHFARNRAFSEMEWVSIPGDFTILS